MRAAIYARVSTAEQELARQLHECRNYLSTNYPNIEEIDEYADIISGTEETGGDEYRRLWDAITEAPYDVVVVHEISRLSRLGPTEIHEFIQHCLEHETGIESLDVGLSIRVDDPALQQTVYTMIANIMGDLAKIEYQQKLQRIESGIRAAQRVGKWTGRPPRGFYIGEDKRLHVDVKEFLETRNALERLARGESKRAVATDTGIPRSTLTNLYDSTKRRAMYFRAEAEDERVEKALDEVRPLAKIEPEEQTDIDSRIRAIVREELNQVE